MNLLSKVLNISNDPLTWLNYFFYFTSLYFCSHISQKNVSNAHLLVAFLLFLYLLRLQTFLVMT